MAEGEIKRVGVLIDDGPTDWQIYQQNSRGVVDIPVSGRWTHSEKVKTLNIRLVWEDSSRPVADHLDWQPATMRRNGTWSGVLKDVPAGGL